MSYSLKKYVSTSNMRVVYRINILYYTLCVCACVCVFDLFMKVRELIKFARTNNNLG